MEDQGGYRDGAGNQVIKKGERENRKQRNCRNKRKGKCAGVERSRRMESMRSGKKRTKEKER